MNTTEFGTNDPQVEAPKIEAAFGLEKNSFVNGRLIARGDYFIIIEYKPDYRYFSITDKEYFNIRYADINLNRDGSIRANNYWDECASELAKGLLYLDMLSPEVETALDITISAHQKAEWLQEYEDRLKASD